jgi:hypothetical protein
MELVGLAASPPPSHTADVYYHDPFIARIQTKLKAVQDAAPAFVAGGGNTAALGALLQTFEAKFRQWSEG